MRKVSVLIGFGLLVSLAELVLQGIRVNNSYSCSYNLDMALLILSMQTTVLTLIVLAIRLNIIGQRNAVWEVMVIMGMFVLIFTVIANFLIAYIMLLVVQAKHKGCLSAFYIVLDHMTLGIGNLCIFGGLVYILIIAYKKTRDWIRNRRARKELSNLFHVIYNPDGASLEQLLDKYQDILNTEPLGKHELAILRDYFGKRFETDQHSLPEDQIQTCAICFEAFNFGGEVIKFPVCMHQYHWGCLEVWLNQHLNCPLCKRDLRPSMIVSIRENYQNYLRVANQRQQSMNQTADLSDQHKSREHS